MTKTEREVTAAKPGDGGPIATPPNDREANKEASGVPAAAAAWGDDVISSGDADFEVAGDVRGLDGEGVTQGSAAVADAQNAAVADQPAGRKLKIKFRGEEREYDEAAAANMIQQHLAVQSGNRLQHLAGHEQVMKALGITDPQQYMQLVVQSLQGGQRPAAAAGDPTVAAGAQVAATGGASAAAPADVEATLAEMESANGIRLPAAMRASLSTLLTNANAVSQIARAFPEILRDVQGFKQSAAAAQHKATLDSVNATAGAVAKELGFDQSENSADYQAFVAYVKDQDATFPGYGRTIGLNAKAMEKALRSFAAQHKGAQALKRQDDERAAVTRDAARAGGEQGVVAARASGDPGAGNRAAAMSFNDKMMNDL